MGFNVFSLLDLQDLVQQLDADHHVRELLLLDQVIHERYCQVAGHAEN